VSQLTPAEGRLDLLGLLPLMPLMVRSPGRLSPDEELRYRYWRGIWIDHGFPGVVHDGSSSHVAARGAALLRRLELREDLGLQEPSPRPAPGAANRWSSQPTTASGVRAPRWSPASNTPPTSGPVTKGSTWIVAVKRRAQTYWTSPFQRTR